MVPAPPHLAADLAALGLGRGRPVLVHCSMRSIGPLAGGPAALLAALHDVAGAAGTIVVPAQTADNSTTSPAFHEATRGLTPEEVAGYKAQIAGFDRRLTPSYRMGVFAEHVRCQAGAVRSGHPQTSFAALGPAAAGLMAVHDLDCHFGERSPLGALYAAGADLLLLGVGYEACTALHLAEYQLPRPPVRRYRCFVQEGARRTTHDFTAVDLDDRDFGALGAALDGESFVRSGRVGKALARLLPIRPAVDFAVAWLTMHRRS